MATEYETTMRADPALNVFKTFGDLNKIGVRPMLAVANPDDFAENIVHSACDINANVIIIPFNPTQNPEDLNQRKHLIESVYKKAANTVVIFIDRGFGLNSENPFTQMTTRSKNALSLMPENPPVVFIPFTGGEEAREALMFGMYFMFFQGFKVVVLNIQTHVAPTMAAGENQGLLSEPSSSTINVFAEDDRMLDSVKNMENVSIIHREGKSVTTAMKEYYAETGMSKRDILIIGKSTYETAMSFIDEECEANVCIVQKNPAKIEILDV